MSPLLVVVNNSIKIIFENLNRLFFLLLFCIVFSLHFRVIIKNRGIFEKFPMKKKKVGVMGEKKLGDGS